MGKKSHLGGWQKKMLLTKHNIFLVQRESDPRTYVLKLYANRQSAVNAITSLSSFDHPNIVKLIDYNLRDCFIVLEYCNYGSLDNADLTVWTDEEKYRCCVQIMEGMEYIHSNGYMKGDSNPKNILLRTDKTPAISDFEGCTKHTMYSDEMGSIFSFFCSSFDDKQWGTKLLKRKNKTIPQYLPCENFKINL